MTLVYVKEIDNDTVQIAKSELEKLIKDAYERGKEDSHAPYYVPPMPTMPYYVTPTITTDKTNPTIPRWYVTNGEIDVFYEQ